MGSLRSLLFAAVFALPIAAAPPARAGRVAPAGAQPSPLPQSTDRAPGEYQIKAEFLLNVAKLTEWPASSFERPDSPLTICVVGGNPFGTALDDTLRNQTAGGHPLQSRVIESGTPRQDCHLLFVPRGREASARPLLQSSRRGAVTVGESDRFLDQGGDIRFFTDDGRIHFDINPRSAEKQGVRFSSQLLRLARRRGPGDPP